MRIGKTISEWAVFEVVISIKLPELEFERLIAEVFACPLDLFSRGIRVEKALKKRCSKVQAIRVYVSELMKEIDSTVERGEHPYLLIKRTVRQKTGEREVEMVFMGSAEERHIEPLNYYQSNPKDWKSWGDIIFTIEQARNLHRALGELLS